jgi:hypothetical protein
LRKAIIGFMSVRLSTLNNAASTRRIFMSFHFWIFFENLSRKFDFPSNLTRISVGLHEHHFTFLIISRSVLLRMRNISDKICRRNQNTFFNRAVYHIMRRDVVERGRPQMTIWRMVIACWIPNATDTHSEYVTLIALPLQHWSNESASLLRYTYIAASLVCVNLKLTADWSHAMFAIIRCRIFCLPVW